MTSPRAGVLIEVDGQPALRFERWFRHDVDRVWRAITRPDELAAWFPSAVIGDRAVGATLVFDDDAQRAAAREAGVTGWSLEGDYRSSSGAECTRALLDRDPVPSALIYDNDVMAVAGLAVAAARRIDVPAELSLLAWDDSPRCRLADPPLSVVSRDVHELGQTVAQALLGTQTDEVASVLHTPQARVVVRGTTAPAPVRLERGS